MRRFIVIAAIAVLFAAPVSVAAQEPMPVDLGSYNMIGKGVVVHVEAGFRCQPKPVVEFPWRSSWGPNTSPTIVVELRQSVSRKIAFGENTWYFHPDELCNGEQQAIGLDILADPSGPPFKAGTAAIRVSGYADYEVVNYDNWLESYEVAQRDTTGWISIKLGK